MSTISYTYNFLKAGVKNARVGTTQIVTITLREVNGLDEESAANSAKARGGSVTTGEELIRISVVAVNGSPVTQPYLAFDTINTRGRAFIMRAFNEINGMSTKEGDDFLATAGGTDNEAPSPDAT